MRRATLIAAFAVGLAALLTLPPRHPPPLLVNESASLPRGLYRLTQGRPDIGAVVSLRQPRSARPYLASLQVPREMRLLKRVAAVGGEPVFGDGRSLRWPRGGVAAAATDRRGVALPRWVGRRALAPDEVLLVGDGPWSFDSRYFGPVRRADLEGVYVEVLRW